MNRYKKANEGIHAPEKLKENAARPAGKRPYTRWMGAVAAVLAVAILGGAAMGSGLFRGPAGIANDPGSRAGGPRARDGGVPLPYEPYALALAAYPETAPYPVYEDYFSDAAKEEGSWEKANEAYNAAYDAWWSTSRALRSEMDYYSDHFMDGFLEASVREILTDAGEENRVYSPVNVYMALSMLAETAGENSRQQILDLLGADSIETVRERAATIWKDHYKDDGSTTSLLANSLWLRDGMTYSQETLDTLAGNYYASAFSGEMGSEEYNQALRDWINGQTNGLLSEQADGLEMEPATVLALASTLYFKAAWNSEFQKERTERDVFHAPSGDVKTDFMRQAMTGAYFWGDRFAAVELNFQQGGGMWLILPDEGVTVDELLESGEAMGFLLADKSGYYDEEKGEYVETWPDQKYLIINLSMPKFDVSDHLDLIDGLKALGVTDVFDMGAANFDPLGAGTDEPLYVSKAEHAARVTVDEEGCEAAAYTVMMMCYGGYMPPDEEVDFTLDRPFLFAITAEWTGLPLFVGTVNQP